MGTFKIQPLDMINAPNYFGILPDSQWQLIGNNPVVLWFQFLIQDTLGSRRYQIANPGNIQLSFLRADTPGQPPNLPTNAVFTPVSTVQTVTVTPAPYNGDRSIFSFSLTSQQAQLITSGTVQVTLTEGSAVQTFNQNYLVKKLLSANGT